MANHLNYNISKEQFKEKIEEKLSLTEIANHFKMSRNNVSYWLRKYNLKFRENISETQRKCIQCNLIKDKTEFYKKYVGKNYLSYNCKKCSNYNTKIRFSNIKKKMVLYKGGKCVECNLVHEILDIYDFHHLNPNEKDFNFIQIKSWSWDRIKIELDKCILVCSNCHRIIHAKLRL